MHGVVENEGEEGVKLVGRGKSIATSRVSEHGDAFKLALITADRGIKREFALPAGYVLNLRNRLSLSLSLSLSLFPLSLSLSLHHINGV